MLTHCPSVPTFPTGAEAPVPLSVSLTAWVPDPELFASATLAQSKMAVRDTRRDLYMLFFLFVFIILNEFFRITAALVLLMSLGPRIRMLSYRVAIRKPGMSHRHTAIQAGTGLVAGDFAGGCVPC